MGEYVKYRGEEIKIGTCENLYYVSFHKYLDALKSGKLSYVPGNDVPAAYVTPDSGYRFRFPFPDEDKMPLGDIGTDYSRGVPVTVSQSVIPNERFSGETYEMYITQQKLIHRVADDKLCLALVWRDPKGESFRLEDDNDIKDVLKQIIRHHISDNPDQQQKFFYRRIAVRILKGYRIGAPKLNQLQEQKQDQSNKAPQSIKKQRGKGL